MKKIYLLIILFSLIPLCSCNFTDLFQSRDIEPQNLKELVELNGPISEYVFQHRLLMEGEWRFTGSMNIELPNGSVAYVKEAVYYGTLLVGAEFTSEKVAERVAEIYSLHSTSFYHKDNYAFTTYFGSFVLFYGEKFIKGNIKDGFWVDDVANGKKILLSINEKQPIIDGTITIDGYEVLVHQRLSFHEKDNFKKVVIGKDVEILCFAALTNNFEVLEFSGDVKEIRGDVMHSNKIFKYTVIPISVRYIGKSAFTQGNVYCEHTSKLEIWDDEFISGTAKVYWAGEWEYDENGVPHPIEKVTSDNITEEA
jgi:hypothetical protein